MFSRTVRYAACFLIGIAALILSFGMLLFQAAFVTGADSDYSVPVSWFSVLRSVMWPPGWRQFVLLLAAILLATLELFIFFRLPRIVGVALLLSLVVLAFFMGAPLGWFLIVREFEVYHFGMDAERLGEYWFIFEAAGIWTFVTAALAVIRAFALKQEAENRTAMTSVGPVRQTR